MEDKDQEKKSDSKEVPVKGEKEKSDVQKKQDARLAERKGQRPAFPFKRRTL